MAVRRSKEKIIQDLEEKLKKLKEAVSELLTMVAGVDAKNKEP